MFFFLIILTQCQSESVFPPSIKVQNILVLINSQENSLEESSEDCKLLFKKTIFVTLVSEVGSAVYGEHEVSNEDDWERRSARIVSRLKEVDGERARRNEVKIANRTREMEEGQELKYRMENG
ncbi:hypothetical protein AVEN_82046-1 [Araneus ventricosus]|uniref:Uncharacterized protein n=1 Tax=Araneus ventricosus TaxID=182803 RepID=A0A4Y2KHI5_ARAVE|nr:hypothetical protein AVEN_82046-1 [Araneus ventricosus]